VQALEILERQRYNLPGFGYMKIRLFPSARVAFAFLERYGHVSGLRQIDQLGPIRDVLPGAHHTRYEYLMAQLALITALCELNGPLPTGMSLGRPREAFGRVSATADAPSNGEILQVLALLGNMGHLPTTFSGERALLKHLRDSRTSRRPFRMGLPQEDRDAFDQMLAAFDVYRLNYFIADFLLDRYRRRDDGPEIVAFCQSILRSFAMTGSQDEREGVAALWRLYRSIRQLTYIALDSHYAPVPFSLDLASIFLSLEEYLGELFLDGSAFHNALERLENVMQDTIYLAPTTLLNHARVSDSILTALESLASPVAGISDMWELVRPVDNRTVFAPPSNVNDGQESPSSYASVSYAMDPELAATVLPDPLQWEREARSTVGLRSCLFGAELNPNKQHLHVAAALSSGLERELAWKACLRACKQLVDLDLLVQRHMPVPPADDLKNGRSMLRLLLSTAFGPNRDYRLNARALSGTSFVARGYGSTKMATTVDALLHRAGQSPWFDADALNEIAMLREALLDISYRGCLVSFAGSTVVLEGGVSLAEFDGIAVLLSRETAEHTMIVVEAKNVPAGHTKAEHQIREQFKRLRIAPAAFEIRHLGNKGAYARVRLPA
jgi:hypothetical protein